MAEKGKLTVVSIESGPRLSQSEPEVADALRNQQAQLEIWLEDQEKRWQEQLAEVERLFRETLDISPPRREEPEEPKASPRDERPAQGHATPMAILPGIPDEAARCDGNVGEASRKTAISPDEVPSQPGPETPSKEAPICCPPGALDGHFQWLAHSLDEWSFQQDIHWEQAYSRLKRLKRAYEAKQKVDEVALELERPQMVHCIPPKEEGSVPRRIFKLFEKSESYVLGTIISAVMVTTIIVSTVTFVLESMPEFQQRPARCQELFEQQLPLTVEACEPVPLNIFSYVEAVCIVIFTIEYLARLCTSYTEPKYGDTGCTRVCRYARTVLNLIDLAAILPFYMNLILGDAVVAFRMLRLMRVLRLLKLAKHHPGIQLCVEATLASGLPLAILMFFNIIFGVIFASVIFYFEGSDYSVAPEFTNGTFPTGAFVRKDPEGVDILTPFRSIPVALWWVFTTTTTVGYGDMAPTSHIGRAVGVLCFYTGIIFLALPIGVLSSNFEAAYARHLDRRRKNAPKLLEVAEHLMPQNSKRVSMFYQLSRSDTQSTMRSTTRTIFKILNDPSSGLMAKLSSYLLTVVIMLTTVTMCLESMPEFSHTPPACASELTVENCRPKPDRVFYNIEFVCLLIFTIDYVLRIATAHAMSARELGVQYVGERSVPAWKATWRYTVQWLNLVDLFAIVPFYLELAGLKLGSSAVIRVLRLIRIFRLLKSPKMRNCVDMIVDIVKDALPGIISVFSLTVLMCVLLASCIWFAEGTHYSVDHFQEAHPLGVYIRPTMMGYDVEISPFRSILHSFWWFFTTATTVGYGDDFPTTTLGRMVAVCTFYTGVVLMAIMLTIVGGAFQNHYPKWTRHNRRESQMGLD